MTTFGQRVAVWSLFGACVEPVWSLCASIDNNERLGSVRAYMYPDRRRRDSSPDCHSAAPTSLPSVGVSI